MYFMVFWNEDGWPIVRQTDNMNPEENGCMHGYQVSPLREAKDISDLLSIAQSAVRSVSTSVAPNEDERRYFNRVTRAITQVLVQTGMFAG